MVEVATSGRGGVKAAFWRIAAPAALCLLVSAPLLAVMASLFGPYGETIRHVFETVGASYFAGTVGLCLVVSVLATVTGVGAAGLVALADFPGRRALSLALALPLAAPAYIAAYAWADLLGPFGALAPVAQFLKGVGGGDIRGFWGAAFILTITLYPYAYLAARAAFARRSGAFIESARLLGVSPARAALRLLAPLARPAIAGAAALIMMETAAEFGVADYYGVPTLSVGIFRTWHAFGDLRAAAQLASALFVFALALVAFEALGRRGGVALSARASERPLRLSLTGAARIAAPLILLVPVTLGFLVPVLVMALKIDLSLSGYSSRGLGAALMNSVVIAAAGAMLTIAAAIALSYSSRAGNSGLISALIRFATLGYAVPGAVIAIGVIACLTALGPALGGKTFLIAGPAALLYAYLARFLTAGYNGIAGGFAAVSMRIDEAGRMLGANPARIFSGLHAPLLRPAILAAAIIVAVDIAKELPATLILRDFNFETLATRVYRLAGDERLAEAAPAALMLIGVSAFSIMLLSALSARDERCGQAASAISAASRQSQT